MKLITKLMIGAVALLGTGPANAAFVIATGTAGTTGVSGLYSTLLATNTTVVPSANFLGTPDDNAISGIGGQTVTYDFQNYRLVNGTGQDFNIYEFDLGSGEFGGIDVLVSNDNINFISVNASGMRSSLDLAGDEMHSRGGNLFSYDLGAATTAGLTDIRYLKIEGAGTGPSGGFNGLDLDGVGVANFRMVVPTSGAVPEPATWAMMIGGFGMIGGAMRRGRQTRVPAQA